MTITRNPFDAGGYSLAEMTQAINILPNLYTRLGQISLFRFEGVTQRSIVIEQRQGVLSLLPSVPLGAPATVGNREARSMRSFALPWIPHDDVILPADIQGMPALGLSDAADPLVEVMNRKLTLMRRKHAQTREYMEMNALRGIVKDGAGTTLYNYFTEFGIEQISVDFVFGTAGTNVQGKVRTVLRGIEDSLLGETMTTAHALVSYRVGAVLGRITASGKMKLSTATGTDGAQNAAGMLLDDVDATNADANAVVILRGPAIVSKAALVFDASVDDATKRAAKHAQLTALGIIPRDTA